MAVESGQDQQIVERCSRAAQQSAGSQVDRSNRVSKQLIVDLSGVSDDENKAKKKKQRRSTEEARKRHSDKIDEVFHDVEMQDAENAEQ